MNWYKQSQTEPSLNYLLSDPGTISQIGPEKGQKVRDGISKFVSKEGSYRYVLYEEGKAVSALQVMKKDRMTAIAANVYTLSEKRRMGYATKLLERAKMDFQSIYASPYQSETGGKSWVDHNKGLFE